MHRERRRRAARISDLARNSGRRVGTNSLEVPPDAVVAVTGATGPDSQDGQKPGTVWFGLFDRGSVSATQKTFAGDPTEVVELTAHYALELLVRCLGDG